jgi:SAM-dependent methyltransferase
MEVQRISDTWEVAAAYERYVGRWSRQVAPLFLSWLRIAPGRRWLDVGCGTGALSEAILDDARPAALAAVEPSAGFLDEARRRLGTRATPLIGNATAIPLPDDAVDVVVSGLVLNFVPHPTDALAEMTRVAVPGGTIGAYVWDYGGGMELMRRFWDAATALDPQSSALDEGVRFAWCRPDALTDLFNAAALRDVAIAPIDIATPFTSFEDCWQPFLGGQGPAPAFVSALGEEARTRLRELLRRRLPAAPDGSIALYARAWAVRGTVPAT